MLASLVSHRLSIPLSPSVVAVGADPLADTIEPPANKPGAGSTGWRRVDSRKNVARQHQNSDPKGDHPVLEL